MRQVETQDPWQTYVHGGKNAIAAKLTKVCTQNGRLMQQCMCSALGEVIPEKSMPRLILDCQMGAGIANTGVYRTKEKTFLQ